MRFADLLQAIKALPKALRADAENDLRARRVWRILLWAPTKRGKSTLLRGTASKLAAPLRMLSIDSDQVDGPGVERCSLPGFRDQAGFTDFCNVFDRQLGPCEKRLENGEIGGVGLDTLTTIGTALESLGDRSKMLTESQMDANRRLAAQSRVLVSLAGAIAGMHGAACKSPLDGPIVLVVTEHAKMIKGDEKSGFAFLGWAPRIGSNGGERVVSLFDAVFAVGLEPPHQMQDLRYSIVWSNRADVGVRLETDERAVWDRCMSQKDKGRADPGRVGDALNEIWALRKASWIMQWLAPHVAPALEAEGKTSTDPAVVLAAALRKASEAVAEPAKAAPADMSSETGKTEGESTPAAAPSRRRPR